MKTKKLFNPHLSKCSKKESIKRLINSIIRKYNYIFNLKNYNKNNLYC